MRRGSVGPEENAGRVPAVAIMLSFSGAFVGTSRRRLLCQRVLHRRLEDAEHCHQRDTLRFWIRKLVFFEHLQ